LNGQSANQGVEQFECGSFQSEGGAVRLSFSPQHFLVENAFGWDTEHAWGEFCLVHPLCRQFHHPWKTELISSWFLTKIWVALSIL